MHIALPHGVSVEYQSPELRVERLLPTKSTQRQLALQSDRIQDLFFGDALPWVKHEHTKDLHGIPVDPVFVTKPIQDALPGMVFGSFNMSLTNDDDIGHHTSLSFSDRKNPRRTVVMSEVFPDVKDSAFAVHDLVSNAPAPPTKSGTATRHISRRHVFDFLDRQVRGVDQLLDPSGTLPEAHMIMFIQNAARSATITDTASLRLPNGTSSSPLTMLHSHRRTEVDKQSAQRDSSLIWLTGVFPGDISTDNTKPYATSRVLMARSGITDGDIELRYSIESELIEPQEIAQFVQNSVTSARIMTTRKAMGHLAAASNSFQNMRRLELSLSNIS
ncbi:MAG: hypothetical protein WBP26_00980 [Candidatus Saccharimonadales bacterium]